MSFILAQGPVLLFLVKATIILVGALLATLAMRRASAGARHLVWLVTLGTLLLVPALTAWGPIRLAVLPPGPAAAAPVPPPFAPAPAAAGHAATPAWTSTQAPRSVQSAPHASRLRDDALTGATMIALAWALVVLVIVAVLLRDAVVLRRIVRASSPLDAPEWRDVLWDLADRLELPDAPRLLRSGDAKMPFACGVRRATIILPAECDGWSLARRRAVLLHELAHVRRHDLVGHMLGRLACAVYWFHPLVWTAAKQLRSESERACDDLALGCGTRASDYAEHLLDIVISVRRASTPRVALAMARRTEFEGRMLAILDPDVRRAGPGAWQAGALVASLAAMAVLVGAATPARRPAAEPAQQHVPLTPTLPPSTPTDADAPTATAGPMPEPTPAVPSMQTPPSTSAVAATVASAVRSAVVPAIRSGTPVLGVPREALRGIVARAALDASGSVIAAITSTAALPRGPDSAPPSERAALLIHVLQTDTSARVRQTAAWGLAQLVDVPGVSRALATALQHDADARVRANAAWGLAQAARTDTAARDALAAAVQHDGDARVRSQAAWALGAVASRAALPALTAALRDTSASVRSNAAWALFTIHDRSTAAALNTAFAREADERVQMNILAALGMMGDAGMPSIRVALSSSNPRVKAAAVEALSMAPRGGDPDPDPDPQP